MKTNSQLFEAYLKCPTKSWLWSRCETGEGNTYAEWMKAQEVAYRIEGVRRLRETVPEGECVVAPPTGESLKAGRWRLAVDFSVTTPPGSDGDSRPEQTLDATPAEPQKGWLSYKQGRGCGFWNLEYKRSNAWHRKEGASRQNLFRFASFSGTS